MNENHNAPVQTTLFAWIPEISPDDNILPASGDDREGLNTDEAVPARLVEVLPRFTQEHGEFHYVSGNRIHIICGTAVPSSIICPLCVDKDDDQHCICGRELPTDQNCAHCAERDRSGH